MLYILHMGVRSPPASRFARLTHSKFLRWNRWIMHWRAHSSRRFRSRSTRVAWPASGGRTRKTPMAQGWRRRAPGYCQSSNRSGMSLDQFAKTSCSNANLCVVPCLGCRICGVTTSCTYESK